MLRDGTVYEDLGHAHFDQLAKRHLTRYHLRRLQELGHRVTIQAIEEVA